VKITLERSAKRTRLVTTRAVSGTDGQFPPAIPRLGNPAWTRIGDSTNDPEGDKCPFDPAIRAYGLGLADYFADDLLSDLGPAMLADALRFAAQAGLTPARARLELECTICGMTSPSLWLGSLSVWLPQVNQTQPLGCAFSIRAGTLGLREPMTVVAPPPHLGLLAVIDGLNSVYLEPARDFFRNQMGYTEQ
jgi:hypothetical protein